jgi:hypothetical protein
MSEEIVNDVVTYGADEELCEIIKEGDEYFLVDLESNDIVGDALKVTNDGSFILPKNRANRKWATVNKVNAALDAGNRFTMTYKATKKFGPVGNRVPNEKLISYLSEEEQEEYKAIIARAMQARNDAKAKPMTEKEKLEAKIAKAQAALAKLLDEAAE